MNKVAHCQQRKEILDDIQLNENPDNSFKFQSQTDQIFLWISQWDSKQICTGIIELMKNCSYQSKVTLSTVLEPLIHGDFIYHKFDTNRNGSFAYPSTFITREIKGKLFKDVNRSRKRQQARVCQLKSTYISSQGDILDWSNNSILPNLKTKSCHEIGEKQVQNTLPKPDVVFKSKSALEFSSVKMSPSYQSISLPQIDTNLTRRLKFINLKDGRTLDSEKRRQFLFQSPSRSTYSSHKSQIILHPKTKSAPASTSTSRTINDKFKHDEDPIFNSISTAFKIQRRHLQDLKKIPIPKKSGSRRSGLFPPVEKKKGEDDQCDRFHSQLTSVFASFIKWTDWQKELFLKNLLKLLNSAQLYFLYASLMVSLNRDFISLLPQQIACKILSYLHPKYLKQCAKVNSKWKSLCEQDAVWKSICIKKGITLDAPSCMTRYYAYKSMKNNWLEGRFKTKELNSYSASPTCLDIYKDVLAAGCTDKTIRIWYNKQKQCSATLEGHQRTIWSVKFITETMLISCSSDHSIKIWNTKTQKCVRTIFGHEGAVWCLDIHGELFATGSADRTAKVWDLRTNNVMRSFSNHPGGIYAVCFTENGQKIFTGSVEKTLKLWDIVYSTCLLNIQIGNSKLSSNPITSLSYDKGFLACVCGTDFQLFDQNTGQLLEYYTDCHKERIECVKIKAKLKTKEFVEPKLKILTSGKDGKIKVWDFTRKKPVMTFNVHDDSINDLLFDDVTITFACQDGVKIMDFNLSGSGGRKSSICL